MIGQHSSPRHHGDRGGQIQKFGADVSSAPPPALACPLFLPPTIISRTPDPTGTWHDPQDRPPRAPPPSPTMSGMLRGRTLLVNRHGQRSSHRHVSAGACCRATPLNYSSRGSSVNLSQRAVHRIAHVSDGRIAEIGAPAAVLDSAGDSTLKDFLRRLR
jgi:hypothetical protein